MVQSREYADGDYGRITDFLSEMYRLTGRQSCWLPQRWEYAEFHVNPLYIRRGWPDWHAFIRLWEENGRIVTVVHTESGSDTYLQLRPGYEYLAEEMLEYLENAVPQPDKDGNRKLTVYAADSKPWLRELLIRRGYQKGSECSYYNQQVLTGEYRPKLPVGYRIVDGMEIMDVRLRRNCCELGFHPERKPESDGTGVFEMETAPDFHPALQLMTQYRDGTLCSFCVIWYDEKLRIGMFEPVCTLLEHRRRGLGREMLLEGLRRLKERGAEKAYVESFGNERKAFYNSAGFVSYDMDYPWTKQFT